MIRNDLKHIQLEVKKSNNDIQFFGRNYLTAEGIELKTYTEKMLKISSIDFAAGFAPNLRGPYTTMYVRRPWTFDNMPGFQQLKKVMLLQT
jgi:methylmalonyl-CoA mutase